ncbi:MAG: DUF4838 domain-containing protein [Ruminococcaceae bacterium]|nr:DUF4838 domain-containing protein [Oscillospiraceae bacterium]
MKHTIIKDGKAFFHICTDLYAHETVRHAASELQKYIYRATKTFIPYFSDKCNRRGAEIRIGGNVRKYPPLSLDDEEYCIYSSGEDICIDGGSPRGVLYGVYAFLEKFLGFRCYTKDVEHIDSCDTLEIELDRISEKPAFEYREAYFRNAFDGGFCSKNRLNSNMGEMSNAQGGRVKWYNFHHSFNDLVNEADWFDTHPEYFSEIDGKRVRNSQLCLSNPEVFELAKKRLIEWIKDNPEMSVFSVAQNDNERRCTCEKCLAVEKEEGSPAGPVIRFVNALSDAVTKDYPHVMLHTFAYQYTLPAPKHAVARDNVIVRICNIRSRHDKPLTELAKLHPESDDGIFIKAIDDWKHHAKRLYVWDYATNFRHYLQPMFLLDTMAENVKHYRDNGIMGVLQQGNFSYGGGAAMDDLKSYIIARLLWNPDCDIEKEKHGFMTAVYGEKAGAILEEYYNTMESACKSNVLKIYQPPQAEYMTDELLEYCDGLFKKAESVAENEEFLQRVKREHLSIRFVMLARKPLGSEGRDDEVKEFFDDIKNFGITEISERVPLEYSERCMYNSQYDLTFDRENYYSLYYMMR